FDALTADGFLVPTVVRLRVVYDGLLGKVVPSLRNQYVGTIEVTKRSLHVIPARCSRPSVNDFDWGSLRRYLKEMQRIDPKRTPKGELHDVVRVARIVPLYRECDVVAFDASDRSMVAFRTFDGEVGLPAYDEVLSRLFEQTPEILPFSSVEDGISTTPPVSLLPSDLAA